MGFEDFAGSTLVHGGGGAGALMGAIILGPRLGKFGKDGILNPIPGHNMPLAAMGVLRVSEQEEVEGLDLSEHDMAAYPDFQQGPLKNPRIGFRHSARRREFSGALRTERLTGTSKNDIMAWFETVKSRGETPVPLIFRGALTLIDWMPACAGMTSFRRLNTYEPGAKKGKLTTYPPARGRAKRTSGFCLTEILRHNTRFV